MAIDLSSPAIIGSFYEALEGAFGGSWASEVGWLNPDSNQESEDYRWLGAVPGFREWLGGRNAKGLRTEAYVIRNKTWEQTLEFNSDDMRRDKTGQVDVRIGELGARGSEHWEELCSDLINANGTAYDGAAFFSATHNTGDSGNVSNLLTGADYTVLSDVVVPTAPTPEEAAKVIQTLIGHFYMMKDDQGKLINGRAKGFNLQVATVPLWAAFSTAISASNLAGGATNPVAAGLKGYNLSCTLNPRLTSATAKVRMFRTDAKLKPFILQEELGVQTSVIGAGSEEEIKNNRQLFATKAIRNAGYGLFQYAIDATLS